MQVQVNESFAVCHGSILSGYGSASLLLSGHIGAFAETSFLLIIDD
jgi:hypothetical protein